MVGRNALALVLFANLVFAPPRALAHDDDASAKPAASNALAIDIVLPDARTVALTDRILAKVDRQTLTATAHGKTGTYEGRDLVAVLKAAGVAPVESLKQAQLRTVVTVTGRDGYQAVFAMAELDPTLGGRQVILVDHENGAALAEADGPWRLVVPDDQRPARWVRQVARITVSTPGP